MLQGHAFWFEERRDHVPKIGKPDVQQIDWEEHRVYVDDMLVKSKEEEDHLDDLKETFNTLNIA